MPRPISTDTLIVCAGLFVLTIVAMMFGSSDLVPYYGSEGNHLQSSSFEGFEETEPPYEGFEKAMEYFHNREHGKSEGFASLNSGDYTNIYAGASAGPSESSSAAMNYGTPLKVTGFDGVQGDAQVENSGMMGFLGPNNASTECKGMGYTKSTGNVCFSPADVQLLTTRGGNFK